MNTPARRRASYADLVGLPAHVVGEILADELITQPRPGPRHALAASLLGSVLIQKFDRSSTDGPGGWWILDEPECHLGSDVLVPDIAGWRQATLPVLPDTAWFDVRPDWVCEVISSSTQKYDRSIKRDICARDGVSHYWIVDPVDQLVELFRLSDSYWTTRVRESALQLDLDVLDARVESLLPAGRPGSQQQE